MFTTSHEDFWIAARRVNGDADGTRQLIDVLLLHRAHRAGDVVARIRVALHVGAVTAEVVAVETQSPPPRPPLWVGPVVTVTSFVTVMTSSKVQGNPSGWCR